MSAARDDLADRGEVTMSEHIAENDAPKWHEDGDGHGYVYQYIGPIHYLCECGDCFLNRERWLAHKTGSTCVIPPANEAETEEQR